MILKTSLSLACVFAVFLGVARGARGLNTVTAPSDISLFASTTAADVDAAPSPLSSSSPTNCAPTTSIPTANLTSEDLAVLEHICWDENAAQNHHHLQVTTRNGIPPGVSCTPTTWCDSGTCTTVCSRGTVAIEPWLANAVRLQARLARTLPLCFSFMLGTHNSAISLADGYGNLDPVYQSLFKYVKWTSKDFSTALLRTNNQWLSLTDQLNLGVRVVEIDTHWVGGVLRVAHCGGLHVGPLNTLVRALNTVAKLLGHHIRWDTETLGCDPSLSSIPALEQRTLVDALTEVAAWLHAPANSDEFLVLFFDDQPNLSEWGVAGHLKEDVLSVFSADEIFSRDDLAEAGWQWPTAAEMVESGRRLLLVSVADYGEAMAPFVFPRGAQLCGWTEPSLNIISSPPACQLMTPPPQQPEHLFTGSLVRVSTCELEYGPLNCDFIWEGGNAPFFDESSLPGVVECGVNIPCPDLLTPSRAAAAVWSWAVGHPFENGGECAVASSGDGRWRTAPCNSSSSIGSSGSGENIRSVCRMAGLPVDSAEQWVLGNSIPPTTTTRSTMQRCPEGSAFDVPRHPRENFWLAEMLRAQNVSVAWLPIQGPDWAVDGVSMVH